MSRAVPVRTTRKVPRSRSTWRAPFGRVPGAGVRKAVGWALRHIGRHLLGLFHGEPGGRAFRRILTEGMHDPAAGWPLVERALQATVAPHAHAA